MPRPLRVHVEGALYAVSARALDGTALFKDARDYQTYLGLLQEYRARFGFKLFAFVLLPDHLMLALELTSGTTISEVMHALNSRYTKAYNKRYGHSGHLFQERFKSTLMEKAPSLLRLTGYLHTLPVRSGVEAALRAYPWSSYPSYLAAVDPSIGPDLRDEVREVLAALATTHPGLTYEDHVRSVPAEAWERLSIEFHRPAVGSEAFLASVEQRTRAAAREASEPARPGRHASEAGAGPSLPAPKPSGPRRSQMVVGMTAMGILCLAGAVLYIRNVTALRLTLRTLARQHSAIFQVVPQEPSRSGEAVLATLVRPSGLAGTSWQVQIRLPENGETVATDHLRFERGTVSSSAMQAEGMAPSNYSLSMRPNGTVLWETMQTAPDGKVVCWRGEWNGRTIRGILTQQIPGQTVQNFEFVGTVASPNEQPANQRDVT